MKPWTMEDDGEPEGLFPATIYLSADGDGIRMKTNHWMTAISFLSPSKARRLARALERFADAVEKGGRK